MNQHFSIGVLFLDLSQVQLPDLLVHVAHAVPDIQVTPGLHLNVGTQEFVRQKQYLPVFRYRFHHLHCIGGGAAVVALRLHLRGGIHV